MISLKKDPTYALLLDDLRKAKSDLELAYSNFENVVDPDLIDSCIYQVNAVQLRYKFLLGRVKQIEDSYAKNPLELMES
ncbi:MAG: YaaL family protein [Lachnospiraceae bacterium]|nr:YaaL family protein [Lachnospiraceae bacterium]MCI9149826.1 YaaL family protein [Lachnospiraceae bacterium]